MSRPSLLRNILYNTLLNVFNILFPLLMLMYVSRKIGPENIGKVNWAISFTSYFVLLASFGINSYGTRAIAQVRDDHEKLSRVFSELFGFSLITTAISIVAYAAILVVMPSMRDKYILFSITGLMVILSPLSLEWFFQGIENFRYIAIRSIVIKFISLVLMILLVNDSKDYLMYALIYVLGLCLNYIFNYTFARKMVTFFVARIDFPRLVILLYRFALISFATSLYLGLDKILLGAFGGFVSVGFYTPAEKIVRTALSIIVAACTVLFPRTSNLIASGKHDVANALLSNTLHAVLLLAIPLFAGIFILAEPLIMLFGGPAFMPSVTTLQIMALIVVPVTIANVAGYQILMASGQEGKYLISVLTGTVTFVVTALIAMPRFKQNGAALSIVMAETIGALMEIHFARDQLRGAFKFHWFMPIFLSTAVMAVLVFWLESIVTGPFGVILACGVAGVVVYFILLFILRDSIIRQLFNKFTSLKKSG
ncbi:MAG: flippase [Spirochaetales bacterium]